MGLVMMGVLRMPLPDDPAELGALEWLQIRDRMREAASEIERLQTIVRVNGIRSGASHAEVDRLLDGEQPEPDAGPWRMSAPGGESN